MEDPPFQEGQMILGEKLRNPYTPEIMSEALSNVQSKGATSQNPVDVRTTHYYVKFSPADWDEYDDLRLDSTLELSDVPFDCPVIQNGNYYHDPAVADSLPTYQYATVPVSYDFNDTIAYEILSSLYVPEEDAALLGPNNSNEFFVDQLLNEAYIITENYDDTIDMTCFPTLDFTPGGNIQINDTRLNTNYGMEGVKVRARRWFTMYIAHPDYNGNYRMKHNFRRKCNYAIFFETNRFNVKQRWHNFLQNGVCWINGPKQYGDWYYTIASGFDRFAGHIFRGAYQYHYKDIGGLKRPFNFPKRVYMAINKDHDAASGWNDLAWVKIWRFEDAEGGEYDSDEIFSSTCHETAHITHAQRMFTTFDYFSASAIVRESWAIGVEWFISHMEYAERGINNYGEWNYRPFNEPMYPNTYALQFWSKDFSDDYTSLFIDIVDDHNELGNFYAGHGIGTIDDLVRNYTFPFIESELLRNISGLNSLSQQLKNNKPAGVTDAQIDLLISQF